MRVKSKKPIFSVLRKEKNRVLQHKQRIKRKSRVSANHRLLSFASKHQKEIWINRKVRTEQKSVQRDSGSSRGLKLQETIDDDRPARKVESTSRASNAAVELEASPFNETNLNFGEEELQYSSSFLEYLDKEKTIRRTWQTRMKKLEDDWAEKRKTIFTAYVKSFAIPTQCCSFCRTLEGVHYVQCLSCARTYCWECDKDLHFHQPFHERRFVKKSLDVLMLRSCQFLDSKGDEIYERVPVPCFTPPGCLNCKQPDSLKNVAGNESVIVVTLEGRFDLYSTTYLCEKCDGRQTATVEDYVISGFWPGMPSNPTYLFSQNLLETWFHLRHQLPGSSEMKFVEVLETISKSKNNINIINRPLFNRAAREFAFCRFGVEIYLKKKELMRCSGCGDEPHSCHVDGNRKLYRFKSAKCGAAESVYGNLAVADDDDLQNHVNLINEHKKTKTSIQKDSCGQTNFRVGREDSSSFNSLDETGLVMGCCRHQHILAAANTNKGESYRIIHHMQLQMWKLGYKYFCYDVVCKYWTFAQDVAKLLPQFRGMIEEQTPFLSVVHGKTHQWDCQVLYNGRWKEGAAATLGEEQEQVFSKMSRYGSVVKHMGKNSRRDFITEAILYWNEGKNENIIYALSTKLNKALIKQQSLKIKLNQLLAESGISYSDLAVKRDNLINRASKKRSKNGHGGQVPDQHRDGSATSDSEKSEDENFPTEHSVRGQEDLEGLYLAVQQCNADLKKIGDTSKKRAKLISKRTKLQAKANNLIDLINQNTEYHITKESFSKGDFPWEVSIKEDFQMVNTWMEAERFEEEVGLIRKEMIQVLMALRKSRRRINDQLNTISVKLTCHRESSKVDYLTGESIILRLELKRLEYHIGNAVANITKNVPTAYLEDSDDDSQLESHLASEKDEDTSSTENEDNSFDASVSD